MRKIRYTMGVIVGLLFIILFFSFYKKINQKLIAEKTINHIPSFRFTQQNGNAFDNKNPALQGNKTLLYYFDPDCDHCQYMAQEILANKNKFSGWYVLMVSFADSARMQQFYEKYQLGEMKNLCMVRDKESQFPVLFGTSATPSFFVYDNQQNLVHKILGETKIEKILN